ncbi:hypothetical protein [Thioclava sp.]|uniref:hypothetical protein n=1 Tax=Thioclava sp. TaxID=1933450 RepID=UPI00324300C8
MTPEQIAGLEALMERVTPDWQVYGEYEVGLPPSLFAGKIGQSGFGPLEPLQGWDLELAVLAPTLARHVLTQQAQIDALAEDAARAHDLALEVERLRGWLSEIDMRAKQYDSEDLADLARDGLNGKPLEGVQP